MVVAPRRRSHWVFDATSLSIFAPMLSNLSSRPAYQNRVIHAENHSTPTEMKRGYASKACVTFNLKLFTIRM